jgi:NTP pyrophosphatase (non-canonical NTP hydrolase)
MKQLTDLSKEIHLANVDKGFYDNPVEFGTQLMLVVSELGEAIEADRKPTKDVVGSECIALKHEGMADESFKEVFELLVKGSVEEEIADSIIRLFDICGHRGIPIGEIISAKLRYNSLRPYKHGKKF